MRSAIAFVTLALSLTSGVFAAPARVAGCDISTAVLNLPAGQTTLAIPTDAKPKYISLGVGTQNYTCSDAGVYVSAGAVADLYDISCLYKTPLFSNIQDIAFNLPTPKTGRPSANLITGILKATAILQGHHYFIPSPSGTGISPLFEMQAMKGPDAFIIAKKLGGIPAPTAGNVDWLQLGNVSGGLAKYIFRVDTKSGTPPASCTPGSAPIQVKYTTKYWSFA